MATNQKSIQRYHKAGELGGEEIGGAAIPIRFWQNISAFELLLPFLLARPRAEQQPML